MKILMLAFLLGSPVTGLAQTGDLPGCSVPGVPDGTPNCDCGANTGDQTCIRVAPPGWGAHCVMLDGDGNYVRSCHYHFGNARCGCSGAPIPRSEQEPLAY